jgi:hypothetical protein
MATRLNRLSLPTNCSRRAHPARLGLAALLLLGGARQRRLHRGCGKDGLAVRRALVLDLAHPPAGLARGVAEPLEGVVALPVRGGAQPLRLRGVDRAARQQGVDLADPDGVLLADAALSVQRLAQLAEARLVAAALALGALALRRLLLAETAHQRLALDLLDLAVEALELRDGALAVGPQWRRLAAQRLQDRVLGDGAARIRIESGDAALDLGRLPVGVGQPLLRSRLSSPRRLLRRAEADRDAGAIAWERPRARSRSAANSSAATCTPLPMPAVARL